MDMYGQIPTKAGDIKPLSPAMPCLPVEAAFLSPSKEVNPVLPEKL